MIKDCEHGCKNDCKNWQEMLSCPQYKPKEEMMENKVIFESVKDFCDFWFVMFGVAPFSRDIEKAQQKGYIRKSPAEEAEEMYKKVSSTPPNLLEVYYLLDVIDKHNDAIQYLKAGQK